MLKIEDLTSSDSGTPLLDAIVVDTGKWEVDRFRWRKDWLGC